MPEVHNPCTGTLSNHAYAVLNEPGTLMLEASYKRIAKAVAGLAISDPELGQRLADIPKTYWTCACIQSA